MSRGRHSVESAEPIGHFPFRRTIAAISGIAVFYTGSGKAGEQGMPIHTGYDSSSALSDLGPIHGGWFDDADPANNTRAVVIVNPDGTYVKTLDELPPDYDNAFDEAISQPYVREAAKAGLITSFTVEADTEDNGSYNQNKKQVSFQISDGLQDESERVYVDNREFDDVAIHETTHAYVETWYGIIEGYANSDDPELHKRITTAQAACKQIKDIVYRDTIAPHRDEVAKAFEDAATKILKLPPAPDDPVKQSGEITSKELMQTAQEVKNNDPRIYAVLGTEDCAPLTVSDIPTFLFADNSLYYAQADYPDAFEALDKADKSYDKAVHGPYACITDGPAIQRQLKLRYVPNAGHSEDNLTEAAASTVDVTQADPDYLPNCMAKLDPPRREALSKLVTSIYELIEYMTPEAIVQLRKNPKINTVLNQFLPAK